MVAGAAHGRDNADHGHGPPLHKDRPMTTITHEGFLRHRGFRDLKIASALCLTALAAYLWHDPVEGPNGGTWLGYTLGGVGTALILMLAWLGVRKRRYGRGAGTVKGWLSAHVYWGLSLMTLVTLHTGFQWGWNVHTLTYALMLLVILSGLYGIVVYSRYPRLITANRGSATQASWLDEIGELNDQALKQADSLSSEVHARVVQSIASMRIGGNAREQLFGRSRVQRTDWNWLRDNIAAAVHARPQKEALPFDPNQQSTVMFMAGQMTALTARDKTEPERLQKLLDVLSRRQELVVKLNRDIQMHARMQIWLYVHVPLSVTLLAALVVHILSVFLYW